MINHKIKYIRVDSCIRHLPYALSIGGFNTVACCCGHGKYPLTIVCKTDENNRFYELISGLNIPRTRNFYKKDAEGYYFIPEVVSQELKG